MMNQYYWSLEDPVMDVIVHHGVKGQSWGKRQWQNPDGSLTPAGRIHYGVGKAKEALTKAGNAIKTAAQDKVKELKYGKTYDSSVIGNYKSKLGKTQYTNLDGTLNEKGKQLASTFTTKEIATNNKYYDKTIDKYKKAAKAYKDDPDVAKKFLQMAKSAEESRNRTNENLKNLSIDQMLQIQMQRNMKNAKIAAGAASIVGAGALVGAATNESFSNKMNDMFNSFGPDTLMNTVNDLSQTEVGRKAFQAVDSSIRMYADARAYVVGTALDQSMNRLNAMGVPQKAGQLVGNVASEAANSVANSGAAEAYAKMGSKFVNTFMGESRDNINQFTTSANQVLDVVDRANKTVGSSGNAVNTLINTGINGVGNTVNANIAGTQRQASQSTIDYVETLKAAGHTMAEIERETGIGRELLQTIF